MSCSYIIVAGGCRRPFGFNMLSTTLLVMMMMIVMSSAEDSITISSLEPKDGMKIRSRMEIKCTFSMSNFLTFKLLKNGSVVVDIQFNVDHGKFEDKKIYPSYGCDLKSREKSGVITCWKDDLSCSDVADYVCETNTVKSSPQSLKAKSYIKSLQEPYPRPEENQISTFRCAADVAKSETVANFRWTVTHGNNADGQETTDSVQVSSRSSCLTTVQSDYKYNVTMKDSSNTTITCTIFSESLSKTFSIQGHVPATELPVVDNAGGMDGGTIAGIVLGVIAFIILVVLLIWFFVIRKRADKPETKPKTTGPPPTRKDYDVRENAIYADSDKIKQSEPSETLTDNHAYENNKAKGSRRRHPKKGSEFLPSHGDATDQMDELDEPYPPPPPPPPSSKPDHPQHAGLHDQLHYAELQLAVEDSRTRRSKFIPRTETPYAEVEIAKLTRD